MAGSFTPTLGIIKKNCYPPGTRENICPRGAWFLAICKAQFEGEALRMLTRFKLGVPQGKVPLFFEGKFHAKK